MNDEADEPLLPLVPVEAELPVLADDPLEPEDPEEPVEAEEPGRRTPTVVTTTKDDPRSQKSSI